MILMTSSVNKSEGSSQPIPDGSTGSSLSFHSRVEVLGLLASLLHDAAEELEDFCRDEVLSSLSRRFMI